MFTTMYTIQYTILTPYNTVHHTAITHMGEGIHWEAFTAKNSS